MTQPAQVLRHGTLVRHANWLRPAYAKVSTLEGCCAKNNSDLAAAQTRAKRNGQAEVWTVYAGAVIHTSQAQHMLDDTAYASAVVLADADDVLIEGRRYTVRFAQGNTGLAPRNSDPIKFTPT